MSIYDKILKMSRDIKIVLFKNIVGENYSYDIRLDMDGFDRDFCGGSCPDS